MPENNPKFRAPTSEAEKSFLPQAGMTVTVAEPFSAGEMAAQVKDAAEYKQSVGNPLAPDCPGCNQPTVIKAILAKSKASTGNSTPGQEGVRDNPWTNSGMTGSSNSASYYNPGSRGGQSLEQKRNCL